jgi:hypothetical protein
MRNLAFVLITALASAGSCAGAYLETSDSRTGSKQPPRVDRMWFDGGRMRSESGAKDDGTIAIFKDQALYLLDGGTHSYRVIDKAAVDQLSVRIAEGRKRMAAAMANMPPERRAALEKAMGQAGGGPAAPGPKRELRNSGRMETVGGIRCAVWEVGVGGRKEQELCAAPAAAVPGGEEMLQTLREVGKMLKGFSQSLAASTASDTIWRDLETINGVPILTRDFAGGKVSSENRMSAARKTSVPPALFEIPAGYTERKTNFGPGGAGND